MILDYLDYNNSNENAGLQHHQNIQRIFNLQFHNHRHTDHIAISMAPSRRRDEESNELMKKNSDQGYTHGEREKTGGCCTKTKCIILFVFLALLGGGVGAMIGIYGLEEVKSWVGLGAAEESTTGTGGGETGDSTPTPYVFSNCTGTGDCCNGLESNCDLKVNEVLYATVHNANHDDRTAFSNNIFPLEDALTAGYRGLMLDVCKCENDQNVLEITFCHGECGFGPRDPTEVFTNINTFLNDNPNDMIVVNFELSEGNPTATELWDVIGAVNGIASKTYDYLVGPWPTMKEMQNTNKQLILFQHNGQNCITNPTLCVSSIQTFHDFALETKYAFKSVAEVEDESYSCVEDRGISGTQEFYAVNNFIANFLLAPSKEGSEVVNEKSFLTKRLAGCEAETGLKPNFINVDFWNLGDVIEVTQEENKLRGNANR